MVERYLMHHGIKGQKWGIRRFQNEDGTYTKEGLERRKEVTNYGRAGGTIKKGSTFYRVSTNENDPTLAKRKYVSTNEYDNALWEDNLINAYRKKYPNLDMYGVKYKTTKDIKVASISDLDKKVHDIFKNDPSIMKKSIADIQNDTPKNVNAYLDYLLAGNYSGAAAVQVRNDTNLGKQIVKELSKEGYGAMADEFGYGVAYDPLIIFDPDIKMKKVSTIKY